MPIDSVEIRLLRAEDIDVIANAFQSIGWNKPALQYQTYLEQQEQSIRTIFVAFKDGEFAGYLTIVWSSDYPPFKTENIPEIQDFNVLPKLRRQGIGTQLIDQAEQTISRRSLFAGIGVGMDADYGAAQRLYVLRGYIPDGQGLVWRNEFIKYGQQVTVDDDLNLHFVKRLAK